jgi:hydroxymethylpyrimidine pyrophosphatase-like HAD family hydrolase/adenine/guanine phosphoribosyltransferase-like PRPP-binding protein
MAYAGVAEDRFYSRYDWCLNPILSIEQLLDRFQEEVDAFPGLEGWQREESRINLYLFACAIACTADDYFGPTRPPLSLRYSRVPQLRLLVACADWLLNIAGSLLTIVRDFRARRWRKQWNSCVEDACEILLDESCASDRIARLKTKSSRLSQVRLPSALLKRRMRLPEAFRGQDFTHYDIISLIQRFCAASHPTAEPLTIVGLRTAGAYFAPLMAAYLVRAGWPRVPWFSIRPKNGTSVAEKLRLRRLRRNNARVLVVDDYPATGNTWRLTLSLLRQAQIRPEQISVVAPTHTAQPNWVKLACIPDEIAVFTVLPSELHKAALLKPEAIESWCAEYFEGGFRVVSDRHLDEINARLAEHSKDGHHVREKRVFAISGKKIFFKSVGWGWLGYHAYLAGRRLEGFVPRVFGLRHGLLVMEWIDGMTPTDKPVPAEQMVDVLASYVAARCRTLRLSGDWRLEKRTYRWTGLDDIVTILRSAYGAYVSRLKTPGLRKQLYKYLNAVPTMLDGRMRAEEWLHTPDGIYKIDFEHHNFGGSEVDLPDPAYDLAAGIFEFELSTQSEKTLLETYRQKSGDPTIAGRIILYKILYGSMAMRYALDRVVAGKEPRRNNDLIYQARNFLIHSMNEFCAEFMGLPKAAAWSDSLFFMDLDGVFDQELMGFPHATESGLQSLKLLQSNGYSVVLNTGRSVEHVRRYCRTYGLPGGVAEFGSVFVDAVEQKELPLITNPGAEQLAKCRDAIRTMPGVFLDPDYEYSIRAYRYNGRATVSLTPDEIKTLLDRPEFRELTSISRQADTYIVQKGTTKGAGLKFVRDYLTTTAPIAAMGDSVHDISMLEAANYAYAPANCSPALKRLARKGVCRIMNQRCQAGLLAAVQHRLEQDGRLKPETRTASTQPAPLNDLMQTLLHAADRRLVLQLLAVIPRQRSKYPNYE